MSAVGQLSLFEPDRGDALRLLQSYLAQATRAEAAGERFALLQQPSIARAFHAQVEACYVDAGVLAIYLQSLDEAGV